MKTAREYFDEAFSVPGRTPRSNAYRCGVMNGLISVLEGVLTDMPYKVGTADADAYFAGYTEGRRIGNDAIDSGEE
jgi:hypothetical protein